MTRKRTIGLAVAALLLLYSAGYAACRMTKALIHTSCILNVDSHGRYHMIHVRDESSLAGRVAGRLFWPLRELEARWHSRGGRLD